MKSIERRVEKIESKLNIGDARTGALIVLIREADEDKVGEPMEEWITYKEIKKPEYGTVNIVRLDAEEELRAGERLQKETEGRELESLFRMYLWIRILRESPPRTANA